ncbi:hypothetical protein [Nocardioides sp. YIM 152315]|uniref:hypothetical protein n=1 Tax=Nocardioides sp. YIM 152315 TaxID=3031760 RepID=UPI0023DC940F|nr:hypothetical protein [Nocardioides sp. YIM 152315]MDF1602992.1 hypothetical protein [Nocardioides sp. YIM 152315]
MVSALLWAVLGGTLIGLLGKLVAPGSTDEVPLWLTILCGIGGCLVGDFLYGLFFDRQTLGVDWWRHGWQAAAAAVLVMLAVGTAGRRRTGV